MIRDILEKLEAKTNVFGKIFSVKEMIDRKAIPCDWKMMDNLGYTDRGREVYHITNERHLKDLLKLQRKKNVQLSTFSRGGGDLLKLPSQPNIVIKLLGDVVIEGKHDIWTLVDKNGLRWIDQNYRFGGKLSFFIEGIVHSIEKQFGVNSVLEISDEKKLYKVYVEKLEKFLDEGGYKYLNEYLNKGSAETKYNEIILTNFKIQKIYSIEVDNQFVERIADKNKIPYEVIYTKDLITI